MNKVIPGDKFTFALKKPVDIEIKNIMFVIQAH